MAVLSRAYLRGTWSARRAINGDADAFVGTATFTPSPDDELVWRESGELRLGDYRGPAARTLLVGDGGVRFDDGRSFHRFAAGALQHRCGADTYDGIWTVHEDDRFSLVWTVTGPGRADRIVCDYARI